MAKVFWLGKATGLGEGKTSSNEKTDLLLYPARSIGVK